MGYSCDRAHQHHLDIIHEDAEYCRSPYHDEQRINKISGGSVANDDEDICFTLLSKKHEENRKINQDHLATTSYVVGNDADNNNNLIVVGGKDTDLDYNYYKYRKEKYDDSIKNFNISNTFQPISKSLDTIVGYANNFLVKLGKLAQQYVIVSKASRDTTCKCNKKTAVNKNAVITTSKNLSRRNNPIKPRATSTPILVSPSPSPPSTSLSTKICSAKTGNNASIAPSDVVVGNNCRSKISTANTTTPSSPSHHHNSCGLVKHSLCLYAASSIIIALCYLTTPIVAYDTVHPM